MPHVVQDSQPTTTEPVVYPDTTTPDTSINDLQLLDPIYYYPGGYNGGIVGGSTGYDDPLLGWGY